MSELVRALQYQISALELPEPEAEVRFHPVRRWRFDLAWPAQKLAVEIDGGTWTYGRHNRPQGYEQDCDKLNTAVCLGWRVIRVTGPMVSDGRALAYIEQALGGGGS